MYIEDLIMIIGITGSLILNIWILILLYQNRKQHVEATELPLPQKQSGYILCKHCSKEYAADQSKCPYCGASR